MTDFGSVFDAIKDEVSKNQKQVDEAERERQRRIEDDFMASIQPIASVLDPVLKEAQAGLAPKGVVIEVDHIQHLRMEGGARAKRRHFQLVEQGKAWGSIAIIILDGHQIKWGLADAEHPNALILRENEVMSVSLFSTEVAENIVKTAIREIMPRLI